MLSRLEIARTVAEREKITIQDAYSIIGTTIDVIAESLEKDNVQLTGLGTFKKVTLPAREGRNPKTGETIQIPERAVVRFKPSKRLLPSERQLRTSRGNGKKRGRKSTGR
ncbi:MAG TPA: HU family DNA-binding protein [Syntrophobacteraceae bacterium]|nr:HU family DNA-binding protein [Syntrophobacteraceae bacterium]